jgi:hypothetical protein
LTFLQEQGLVYDKPYPFSYRTLIKSQVLTLRLSDWEYLLNHFPNSKKLIYKFIDKDNPPDSSAKSTLGRYKDPFSSDNSPGTEASASTGLRRKSRVNFLPEYNPQSPRTSDPSSNTRKPPTSPTISLLEPDLNSNSPENSTAVGSPQQNIETRTLTRTTTNDILEPTDTDVLTTPAETPISETDFLQTLLDRIKRIFMSPDNETDMIELPEVSTTTPVINQLSANELATENLSNIVPKLSASYVDLNELHQDVIPSEIMHSVSQHILDNQSELYQVSSRIEVADTTSNTLEPMSEHTNAKVSLNLSTIDDKYSNQPIMENLSSENIHNLSPTPENDISLSIENYYNKLQKPPPLTEQEKTNKNLSTTKDTKVSTLIHMDKSHPQEETAKADQNQVRKKLSDIKSMEELEESSEINRIEEQNKGQEPDSDDALALVLYDRSQAEKSSFAVQEFTTLDDENNSISEDLNEKEAFRFETGNTTTLEQNTLRDQEIHDVDPIEVIKASSSAGPSGITRSKRTVHYKDDNKLHSSDNTDSDRTLINEEIDNENENENAPEKDKAENNKNKHE